MQNKHDDFDSILHGSIDSNTPQENPHVDTEPHPFSNPEREVDYLVSQMTAVGLMSDPDIVARDENGQEDSVKVHQLNCDTEQKQEVIHAVLDTPLGESPDSVFPGARKKSIEEAAKVAVEEAPTRNPPSPPETQPFFLIFILFYFTFDWMNKYILKGIFSHPQIDDVPQLPKKLRAQRINKQFAAYWEKYKKRPRPLLWVVGRMIWLEYTFAGFCNLMERCLDLAVPIMLAQLLKHLEDPTTPDVWKGYVWATAICVTKLFWAIAMQSHLHFACRSGMLTRSGLVGLLYSKSLLMQKKDEAVMTLIAVDAMKIDIAFQFLHFSWSSVFQIAVSIGFLASILGWATCAGVLVILTVIPIQYVAGKLSYIFQSRALKWTDIRVRTINEIVSGIQLCKFYTYELSYLDKVKETRSKELRQVLFVTLTRALSAASMSIVPVFVSVSSFALYVILGGTLSASLVFPALTYFEMMRIPLTFMTQVISNGVNANVSLRRMEKYLQEEEVDPSSIQHHIAPESTSQEHTSSVQSITDDKISPSVNDEIVLRLVNASYEWPHYLQAPKKKSKRRLTKKFFGSKQNLMSDTSSEQQEIVRIQNANLEVKRGELVLIIGEVGSGKSSLLSCMLGEMKHLSGHVEIEGSVSYVPQNAFLRNATLRENVLFSLPMDPQRYEDALHHSGLEEDLAQLGGDMTEIGSRGVNLSGGQKMRICIARSIYANRDIYMLDDCLSALDASVGRFIFEDTIKGYLHGKTRLMVTHQIHFASQADRIIVMDEGQIAEQGTYEELMQYEDGILRKLIEEHVLVDMDDVSTSSGEEGADSKKRKAKKEKKKGASTQGTAGTTIIQAEERKKGRISPKVFFAYAQAMGGTYAALFVIALFCVAQLFLSSPDVWLSLWIGESIESLKNKNTENLLIYASLGIAAAIVVACRDSIFFTLCLRASKVLHENAFRRIIRAPMGFFEAQPMARIVSRFSGDTDLTDYELIQNISMASVFFLQVVAVGVIICASTSGIFIVPLIIVVILYLFVSEAYTRSSREYKRLDSITRSPVMSQFSESLSGNTVIRAFKLEDRFREEQLKLLNINLRCYYILQCCSRWMSIRLDVLGALLILLISICALLIRDMSVISSSLLALGITYGLQFNRIMSFFVRNASLAEININAVERLAYYGSREIPNEAPLRTTTDRPPKGWPSRGVIKFENVHFRYRPDLPDTLKNINLEIEAGQHVAFVGRTGSGKSSTILSLFRERELSAGKILIDGVDISKIGLHDLREQLVIVPQTPVCFSGTIKSNLDPMGKHKDEALWDALDKAYLKTLVEKLGGLNATVEEEGSNLSIGERALLVLARALLQKGRILISDEASASIDYALEQKIQETIAKHFASHTTITIAHRIQTIIDSDVIVVLSAGEIVEKGSPRELLKNPDSIFFGLVRDTGETSQRKLMHTALGDEFDRYYSMFQRKGEL